MKKQVYFNAARREALGAHLAEAAATITAAGDTFRELFPALAWNTRALWVLAFEPEAREHYCREILKQEEEASRLPCDWDREEPKGLPPYPMAGVTPAPRPEPLSEELRLNRKLVEIRTRAPRERIQALGNTPYLEDYLRAGVLYIGKAGDTLTAKDAEARLDDFCTLFAEGKQQADFVEGVERMRAAAAALAQAFQDTEEAAQGERFASILSNCRSDYSPARLELLAGDSRMHYGYSAVRLMEPDAAARALVTLFGLEREAKGAAKFYNLAGIWAYNQQEAEAAAGCELKEGTKYPQRHPYLFASHSHLVSAEGPKGPASILVQDKPRPKFCRPLAEFK